VPWRPALPTVQKSLPARMAGRLIYLTLFSQPISYRPREESQSMTIWAICWLLLSSITMCSFPVMGPG
jgi:hypothetical protein